MSTPKRALPVTVKFNEPITVEYAGRSFKVLDSTFISNKASDFRKLIDDLETHGHDEADLDRIKRFVSDWFRPEWVRGYHPSDTTDWFVQWTKGPDIDGLYWVRVQKTVTVKTLAHDLSFNLRKTWKPYRFCPTHFMTRSAAKAYAMKVLDGAIDYEEWPLARGAKVSFNADNNKNPDTVLSDG